MSRSRPHFLSQHGQRLHPECGGRREFFKGFLGLGFRGLGFSDLGFRGLGFSVPKFGVPFGGVRGIVVF